MTTLLLDLVLISVQGAAEGVRPYEGQGAAGAPLHRARRREGHEGGATGENTTEAGHITCITPP
jgi:hypothetical protein